jgi:hypothetical protein
MMRKELSTASCADSAARLCYTVPRQQQTKVETMKIAAVCAAVHVVHAHSWLRQLLLICATRESWPARAHVAALGTMLLPVDDYPPAATAWLELSLLLWRPYENRHLQKCMMTLWS